MKPGPAISLHSLGGTGRGSRGRRRGRQGGLWLLAGGEGEEVGTLRASLLEGVDGHLSLNILCPAPLPTYPSQPPQSCNWPLPSVPQESCGHPQAGLWDSSIPAVFCRAELATGCHLPHTRHSVELCVLLSSPGVPHGEVL